MNGYKKSDLIGGIILIGLMAVGGISVLGMTAELLWTLNKDRRDVYVNSHVLKDTNYLNMNSKYQAERSKLELQKSYVLSDIDRLTLTKDSLEKKLDSLDKRHENQVDSVVAAYRKGYWNGGKNVQ